MDNIRIRCPKCNWEPDGKPYWVCNCCDISWDTFALGARCPHCKKVWDYTSCIPAAGGCNKMSPHLDWYEGLDDVVKKLKEELIENGELKPV